MQEPTQPFSFADHTPPQAIGAIMLRHSTDGGSSPPRSTLKRLVHGVLSGVVIFAVSSIVFHILDTGAPGSLSTSARITISIFCAGIVGLIVFRARRRRQFLSFVGTQGIAQFSGFEDESPAFIAEETMLFCDAAELRRSMTHMYVNGGYGGSNFFYSWLSPTGTELFAIRGAFRSEIQAVAKDNLFHVASAAENAWNTFLANRLHLEKGSDETFSFRVFDTDSLNIGRGFLDCCFQNRTTRLTPQDAQISIEEGVLEIRSETQKIHHGSRNCRIHSGRISNLDLLLRHLRDDGGFAISNHEPFA